jgi:hypothetical protein
MTDKDKAAIQSMVAEMMTLACAAAVITRNPSAVMRTADRILREDVRLYMGEALQKPPALHSIAEVETALSEAEDYAVERLDRNRGLLKNLIASVP